MKLRGISMKQAIENLIQYEIHHQIIDVRDYTYVKNQLYRLVDLEPTNEMIEPQMINFPSDALDVILDALEKTGKLDGSQTARDLFDAKLMNVFAVLPSVVEFKLKYLKPEDKMHWLYQYARSLNYIRMDRIVKNKSFHYDSEFGQLQITINLSKPEKDPKSIANALKVKQSDYPKCVLCKENEGFSGNAARDSRDQHRLIKFELHNEPWYFQYSPYIYYNEHAIVLSDEHRPMHIDTATFSNLLTLTDKFEGYFFGSNADLPIVGGSILTHDHYQGGRHTFPIENASVIKAYQQDDVTIELIKWPLSTIRLRSNDQLKLISKADHVLKHWKAYNNNTLNIKAFTDNERHHTITPIARKLNDEYELDLVLRDNHRSDKHPLGIFHPHEDKWHIKKENIGLIEAMGLAILPKRLVSELDEVKRYVKDGIQLSEKASIHQPWIESIKDKLDLKNLDESLHQAVGHVFEQVLVDCGVFKLNEQGIKAFDAFILEVLS